MHMPDKKVRQPYSPIVPLMVGKDLLIKNADRYIESVLIDMPIVRS